MMPSRVFVCLLLIAISVMPAVADSASSAYKAGVRAEKKNDYDAAYRAFKTAYEAKPNDPRYGAGYTRMRFHAAAQHVLKGEALRDQGKLQDALAEFQIAIRIDSADFAAQQEIRRTAELLRDDQKKRSPKDATSEAALQQLAENIAGPIELQPTSDIPVTLRMTAPTDVVYKTIGKLAGINVLVDSDYKPQKISIELNDVSFRQALAMVALQSKTYWRAVSPNTIIVTADSPGKRKEMEENVLKTFYLHNISNPAELQESANIIKGILDVNRIQVSPEQRAITLRGTPDQMVLAQRLLMNLDKPRPEVLIEVAVMQVSKNELHTLGVNWPTSASVSIQPGGNAANGSSGSSSAGQLTLNSLAHLTANDFLVSIPGWTLTALMTDSNTKVIQRPEIRALDSEKATLRIGDRVPIATGSFQASGISPLVNTQFQYLDVGVNVDITPYVHFDNNVTLKMVLEISSVTGVQNIGGINQPTIGQRRIEHTARLADGEVNLIGGIMEKDESQSLSGYPWIAKLPVLKYLFGQETKQVQDFEIVFAIIPHIVRSNQVTTEDMRMVDIGTGNTISIRDSVEKVPASATKTAPGQPAKPEGPAGASAHH